MCVNAGESLTNFTDTHRVCDQCVSDSPAFTWP